MYKMKLLYQPTNMKKNMYIIYYLFIYNDASITDFWFECKLLFCQPKSLYLILYF